MRVHDQPNVFYLVGPTDVDGVYDDMTGPEEQRPGPDLLGIHLYGSRGNHSI